MDMRRVIVATAVAALLLLAAPPSQAAISNDPTALYLDGRHIAQPVDWQTWCGDCVGLTDTSVEPNYTDQEPWTVNPGWVSGYTPPVLADESLATSAPEHGCLWDSDDYFDYKTRGTVFPANTTLTATECRWRDSGIFNQGGVHNYIKISSSSPELLIRIKWDWGSGFAIYNVTPTSSGQTWNYVACLTNPTAPTGAFIPVPDSHDGMAIWEVITVTMINPTSRKISKTGGIFGAGWLEPSVWCSSFVQV
jgi:hypothetical protein